MNRLLGRSRPRCWLRPSTTRPSKRGAASPAPSGGEAPAARPGPRGERARTPRPPGAPRGHGAPGARTPRRIREGRGPGSSAATGSRDALRVETAPEPDALVVSQEPAEEAESSAAVARRWATRREPRSKRACERFDRVDRLATARFRREAVSAKKRRAASRGARI